jgi:heme a synthase
VTAHLATALALVALLSGVHQALLRAGHPTAAPPRWWLVLLVPAFLLVVIQCLLGGTLATTWAAERCLAAGEGCQWLWRHRLAAQPAAAAVLLLLPASWALPSAQRWLRWASLSAALLVALQVALGVTTLRLGLAVPAVTIAHQAIAALLVAVLAGSLGRSFAAPSPRLYPEPSHG